MRKARRGSTLQNLLIVLAFLMVFAALAIPAVVKVRMAAARAACTNNLRQLGLATHTYASTTNGRLPPLTANGECTGSPGYRGSLYFSLLPFIEQEALYRYGVGDTGTAGNYTTSEKNMDTGAQVINANVLVSQTPVKTFLCPVDKSTKLGICPNDKQERAGTSYSANYMLFAGKWDSSKPGNPFQSSQFTIDVPDGTTNTIFFVERHANIGTKTSSIWAESNFDSAPALTTQPYAGVGSGSGGQKGEGAPFAKKNSGWKNYNKAPELDVKAEKRDPSRAGGSHPGTCHIGLADGSAKAVAKISDLTWQYAIDPNDKNPMPADW